MKRILSLLLFSLAYASSFGQCTITLTSSPGSVAQTICSGSAIVPIVYNTTGANGIGSLSSLPAGVTASWASNTITISGTPTVSGSYNYSIPLTGGGCGSVNATGTINVTANNTITLSSSAGSNAQTRCIGSPIVNITYSTTGATGATVAGLPNGVTGSWASGVFTIAGTPTQSGNYVYTVTMTGGCSGGTNTASGNIVVNASNTISLTSASGPNNQTLCVNTQISNITYATTGATGATITGLPNGVSGSWTSGVFTISGTPSVSSSSPFNYTVTMTGGCSGATNTASGSILVNANNTISLTSLPGTNNQTRCINSPISNITYETTGATGATVTGLPNGVTGSWASGVFTITGAPTQSGNYSYTVTMTGGCTGGTNTANGSILVNAYNTISLTSLSGTNNQTRCINSQIDNITYATTGATGATVTGLPSGVAGSLTSGVFTISGTPAQSGAFSYTVTMTGGCTGGTNTAIGNIAVNANNTISLTSGTGSDIQNRCIETPIGTITYATTGATGATVTGLPNGVTGSWTPGVFTISGTPSVSGATPFNYTVTMTGGCTGGTNAVNGSITVNPASDSNVIEASQESVCSAITPFTNAVTLSSTAAAVGARTWQSSNDGINFSDFSNSNLQNYVLNNLVTDTGSEHIPVTKYYRLKTVSGVCPADFSAAIPILIKPRPKSNNRNYTICSGEIFGFTPTDDANTIVPDNTILDYEAAGQGNITGFSSQSNQSTINAELVNLDYVNNSVVYSVIPSYQECEGSQFQIAVNVLRHPEIIASEDENICEGESIQLYSVDLFNAPGTYFDWTNGDIESLNFPYISNPVAQPETTTQYIVSMRDPINTQCYGSDTVTVTVNSKPYFEITGPTGNICTGNTYIFQTAEETNVDQLVWASSNAEIVIAEMNQLVAQINEPGEIGISALATSEEGCTYSSQLFVEAGETPSPDIQGSTQLCLNNEISEYYTLSPDNGFQWQIANGVVTSGNGTPGIEVSWNQSGIGQVVLTETEWQSGCTANDTLEVYLSEVPFFTLHPTNASICSGSDLAVDIQSDAEYQFEWTIQNANLISTSPLQAIINSGTPGTVILSGTAYNLEGCSYTNFVELNVGATPSVDISGPSDVCANSVYQPYEGYSQFGNGLTWTIENGAVTNGQGTTNAEVSWFAGNEGTIILTAHEWQSGCEASDSLVVSFEGEAPGIFAVEMLGQNTTVLLCSNSSFPFYRWGYTLASTGVETTFNSNAPYFEYNQIDVINYYYWVEYGAVDGCMTRSYYNAPPIVTAIPNEDSATDNDFIVYPNPVNDVLTISSKNWTHNAKVEVLTSTGTLLDSRLYSGYLMPLDLSKYSGGIYFIKLTTSNSIQVFPIVKR